MLLSSHSIYNHYDLLVCNIIAFSVVALSVIGFKSIDITVSFRQFGTSNRV